VLFVPFVAFPFVIIPAMTFQESLASLNGDRRNVAIFEIGTTFAVLAGAIYVLTLHPGAWSYPLVFVIVGLMQYRIVMACHEAVHRTLLFPLWLNEIVGTSHCALVGINLFWYRKQHLGHHAAKDLDHDTDAYIYAPILRSPPGLRRVVVWIFGTAGEVIQKIHQKGFAAGVSVEAGGLARFYSFLIFAAQFLLLACSAVWLSWWYYFVFWLAPLLTIAIFMNRTRVLVEHGYPHETHPTGTTPVATINLSANAIERFFIAPFRFNYHLAHHLAPSVPSYKNAELSRLFERHGKTPSAIGPSYARALQRILWG
jgi:fatty acid desaturase